jgi:methyltransferase (TIGR00027 family)
VESGQSSRTAWEAAFHRAAHQLLERGHIFRDPLAVTILGEDVETITRKAEERPSGRAMRLFIAARTRFAEDALAAAAGRGVRQLVVLGAGLDTYAYRGEWRDRIRIFEVDHPATQEWKRRRLAEAGIAVPEGLTFAPIDFERQTLAGGLEAAGFDPSDATFFTWLGVTPYLTKEAIWETLGFIASLPRGAHVIFDYTNPPEALGAEARARFEKRAAHVAELGEKWISFFDAEELQGKLTGLGFLEIEDWGPGEIARRFFPSRTELAPQNGGHILHATTMGR